VFLIAFELACVDHATIKKNENIKYKTLRVTRVFHDVNVVKNLLTSIIYEKLLDMNVYFYFSGLFYLRQFLF